MQGMGLLFQVHEPFWTLTLSPGVEGNPLNYSCAPNQATPDYVASGNVRDFIAYGFLCCFDSIDPDNFTMWNMVQRKDVQWLRECFLRVLEKLYPFTGANRHTYMDGAAYGGSVDSARERGAGYGGKVMAR